MEALAEAVFDHIDGHIAICHGTDDRGLTLDLGLIADDRDPNRLACIHAMPLKWRD